MPDALRFLRRIEPQPREWSGESRRGRGWEQHPDAPLMSGAPWLYQAHTLASLTLFALWPFGRLVHVWTAPVRYAVRRAHILYRGAPATSQP